MTKAIDLKLQQSNCFKLLAVCFYEPEKEWFMREELCENLFHLLTTCGYADAATAAHNMKQALVEKSAEEMKVDYAALFVGPFELHAPPYGSVYLETTKRLMGDSTMAVMKMYQDAGLSVEAKEAPDHIAIELEFMHYLYTLEAEAVHNDNNEKVQNLASMRKGFLSAYLASWVPRFCQKIRTSADNLFYRSLADCLENFIEQEVSSQLIVNMDGATEHAYQLSAR